MSTNFTFLKTVDKNLFEIISDAEKLYRDEYFEQCIGQTRRFAESVCKNVLGERYTGLTTFDEMLATLKDKSKGSIQEREFIDDLYFLKQQGNQSLHSSKVKRDGVVALECLRRAFEVAINYCVYTKFQDNNLLKQQYDIELLITGKKNKSLALRYSEKKAKVKKEKKIEEKVTKINAQKRKSIPQKKSVKRTQRKKKQKGLSFFTKFMLFCTMLSLCVILGLFIFSIW